MNQSLVIFLLVLQSAVGVFLILISPEKTALLHSCDFPGDADKPNVFCFDIETAKENTTNLPLKPFGDEKITSGFDSRITVFSSFRNNFQITFSESPVRQKKISINIDGSKHLGTGQIFDLNYQ